VAASLRDAYRVSKRPVQVKRLGTVLSPAGGPRGHSVRARALFSESDAPAEPILPYRHLPEYGSAGTWARQSALGDAEGRCYHDFSRQPLTATAQNLIIKIAYPTNGLLGGLSRFGRSTEKSPFSQALCIGEPSWARRCNVRSVGSDIP